MTQNLVNRGARKTPNNSGANITENTVTNKSKRKTKKKKVVAGGKMCGWLRLCNTIVMLASIWNSLERC